MPYSCRTWLNGVAILLEDRGVLWIWARAGFLNCLIDKYLSCEGGVEFTYRCGTPLMIYIIKQGISLAHDPSLLP